MANLYHYGRSILCCSKEHALRRGRECGHAPMIPAPLSRGIGTGSSADGGLSQAGDRPCTGHGQARWARNFSAETALSGNWCARKGVGRGDRMVYGTWKVLPPGACGFASVPCPCSMFSCRPGRRLTPLAFARRLVLSRALFMLSSYRSSSPLPVGIDLLSARLLVVARLAGAGGFGGIGLRADGCQLPVMAVCGRCALRPGWLFLRTVALPALPGIPSGMFLRHG